MATNESTTFADGNIQPGKERKQAQQNTMSWQQVTIGGVTGVLMGAGTMYAATVHGKEEPEVDSNNAESAEGKETPHAKTDSLKVADVSQDLTFGEAFKVARAEVGAGGVFHWHGNIYNTYTAAEWDGMSAGEKAQFAQQVQPEVRPGEGKTSHRHDYAHVDHKPEETKLEEPTQEENKQEEPQEPEQAPSKPKPEEDGEVHFLGFSNIEVDGQEYVAGHTTQDGKHVYFVDMDNDPEHRIDHAVADVNQDGTFSSDEVIPFEGKATLEDFGLMSILEAAGGNINSQTAQNTQENIANDLPDYMNEAETVL